VKLLQNKPVPVLDQLPEVPVARSRGPLLRLVGVLQEAEGSRLRDGSERSEEVARLGTGHKVLWVWKRSNFEVDPRFYSRGRRISLSRLEMQQTSVSLSMGREGSKN